MKKHVPATDMTFGQLYDAVASGGEFCINGLPISISEHKDLVAKNKGLYPIFGQSGIFIALNEGRVTRLVETPWTDQLDGTWENGVWCMCQANEKSHKAVDKITWNASGLHPYESISARYFKAEPLPQHLADELEALSKQ